LCAVALHLCRLRLRCPPAGCKDPHHSAKECWQGAGRQSAAAGKQHRPVRDRGGGTCAGLLGSWGCADKALALSSGIHVHRRLMYVASGGRRSVTSLASHGCLTVLCDLLAPALLFLRVGSKLSSMLTRADKSPTFPKMHNMRKYPGAILRLGNVQHANTAGREGAIRPLRECWERTDKHPRTLSRHVAQKVQLFEDLSAASRRQAAANPPHRRGGTGVVSSCVCREGEGGECVVCSVVVAMWGVVGDAAAIFSLSLRVPSRSLVLSSSHNPKAPSAGAHTCNAHPKVCTQHQHS
jgi:hypothetical protein